MTSIITLSLQVGFDLFREYVLKGNNFDCVNDSRMCEPKTFIGSVYAFFDSLINLIPCVIVPYAFYFVPFIEKKGATVSI